MLKLKLLCQTTPLKKLKKVSLVVFSYVFLAGYFKHSKYSMFFLSHIYIYFFFINFSSLKSTLIVSCIKILRFSYLMFIFDDPPAIRESQQSQGVFYLLLLPTSSSMVVCLIWRGWPSAIKSGIKNCRENWVAARCGRSSLSCSSPTSCALMHSQWSTFCISDDTLIVPLLAHTAFTMTTPACLLEHYFLVMSYEQTQKRIN